MIGLLAHVAATQDPIKVSAVAAALDLPSSTAHRLIGQFVELGLLKRLPGSRHYTTGTEALRLGTLLSQHDNIVEYAMPHLHRIVQASGESCALGLYRESDATMFFAAQVHSAEPLRYHINLFRSEPQDGQYVLIREGKLGPWALAQYDPTPGVLPRRLGPVFARWEAAEWAVFKLRWKKFTGQDLAIE